MLAVFGNDVFIFFDREAALPRVPEMDPLVLWSHWKRNVIDRQVKTAHGAERYFLSRLPSFLDGKRAPAIAYEALQCHGGKGHIEENPMARLYREAPLNSVWEGTANMMCMDVRHAMLRTPETRDALIAEFGHLAGQDERFDRLSAHTAQLIDAAPGDEYFARPMTEAVARTLQGAQLLSNSTADVVDAFFSTRVGNVGSDWGVHFGTLGGQVNADTACKIVHRSNVLR